MKGVGESVANAELGKLARGGEEILVYLFDIAAHALADLVDQLIHLAIRTLHDQLDSPIREVANVASDVVTQGDILHCVSKANALHVTREIAGLAMKRLGRVHGGA